jgi:thiol:disulfide interchange protein DsbD
MYATAAFMAWVFAQQTRPAALGLLLGASVALGLCGYLLGQVQRNVAKGRRSIASLGAGGAAAVLTAVLMVLSARASGAGAAAHTEVASGPPSEPYSPERLSALRAEGRPVLVNFTAAWCVTCRVNEQVAFASKATTDAFVRTGAVYMVGDWTRRDDTIARALAEEGRSGVPLYLVYGPRAAAPKVLPQILTSHAVVRALEDASQT